MTSSNYYYLLTDGLFSPFNHPLITIVLFLVRLTFYTLLLLKVQDQECWSLVPNYQSKSKRRPYVLFFLTSPCPDVAFDILYAGDTSVIHQTLKERHELLRKVVKPFKGHLEILVPDDGLNSHRPPGKK